MRIKKHSNGLLDAFKLNHVCFAGEDGTSETSADTSNEDSTDTTSTNDDNTAAKETYTHADIVRMMTKEKNEGRKSALKELGFNDTDLKTPKTAIATFKTFQDSQKTALEKANEGKELATTGLTAAEQRAEKAERKLSLIDAGAKKEFIDDIFALANSKVSEDVDFEAALAEVKTKHASFFEDGESGSSTSKKGTGSAVTGKRTATSKNPAVGMGARLAQQKIESSEKAKETKFF